MDLNDTTSMANADSVLAEIRANVTTLLTQANSTDRATIAMNAQIGKLHKMVADLTVTMTTLAAAFADNTASRAKPAGGRAAKKVPSEGKQPFVDDVDSGEPAEGDEGDNAPNKTAPAIVVAKPAAKPTRVRPTAADLAIANFVAAISNDLVTVPAIVAWRGDNYKTRGMPTLKRMFVDFAAHTQSEDVRAATQVYIEGLSA